MNKQRFLQHRRGVWQRFEELLRKFGPSQKATAKEVSEFSRLFRELCHDLAMIRSRSWGRSLISYLNQLVVRGHNQFYTGPPANLRDVLHFLAYGFPQLLRANVGYFLVAAALFFVPGAISWAVIQNDPTLANRILPSEALEQFNEMYGPRGTATETDDEESAEPVEAESSDPETDDDLFFIDDEDDDSGRPFEGFAEERSLMAGFYVRNNVGIALLCFARGILLGVGTVYTLLYNGIAIGAIGGYIISQGHSERFLSFVVSHGSFELTAIAVAGGAGLMLGNAIIHPGQRTIWESLAVRGLDAVKIACGAAVMLVVAALIEAYWSPSPVPVKIKYLVGGVLWVVVFLYLAFAGRGR
jgi:uncharacterized membrane protein SpoIIM required for sporulation